TLDVKFKIIGQDEWVESDQTAYGSPGVAAVSPVNAEAVDAEANESDNRANQNGRNNGAASADAVAAQRRRKRDELLNPTLRAVGICGSGIIEAIAELFLAGVIAPNGRFVEIAHPRLRLGLGDGGGKAEFVLAWPHETNTGDAITVHSDDIRAIQLGKAALYAGAKLLMNRLGLASVDSIMLAGGFGSYIDPIHAMILGLIPDCDLAHVQAVGNAAGDGARMILLDKQKRAEASWAARWVTYVETAVEPSFQHEFVGAINIPHATDAFPHLAAMLSAAQAQWPPDRMLAMDAMRSGGSRRASRSERTARRERRTARRDA
ncbi:MAG: DUF4445 domain-containing protein, partial [Caldilineaceae bacterium]|nr:DUF4445 domain-containing protein [Caldilineaceae bacterium]